MEHIIRNQKRVIPVLTMDKDKLVKTIRFKKPNYIGDPINAVKIFNDKEVDEIVLLDITASIQKREPNYSKVEEICSEAFMPFAYGGGITKLSQVNILFSLGIEKVVLNSVTACNLDLIQQILEKYGSQSIVGSVDVGKNIFGKKQVYTLSGTKKIKKSLEEHIREIINSGIGELFINSIYNDGTYSGYDLELIKHLSELSEVPIIACGGASKAEDFKMAIDAGASAVAAGSLFVYRSEARGIMINYFNNY